MTRAINHGKTTISFARPGAPRDARRRLASGFPAVLGVALFALLACSSLHAQDVSDTVWNLVGTGQLKQSVGEAKPERVPGALGFLLIFDGDGSFSMANSSDAVFASGAWTQKKSKVVLELLQYQIPVVESSGVLGGMPDVGDNTVIDLAKWKLACKLKRDRNGNTVMFFSYKAVFELTGGTPVVVKAKFKGSGTQDAASSSATVSWKRPKKNVDRSKADDLESFRIYYKKIDDDESEMVDVADPKAGEHTIDDLDPGALYTFSITAVDNDGNESDESGQVFKSFP